LTTLAGCEVRSKKNLVFTPGTRVSIQSGLINVPNPIGRQNKSRLRAIWLELLRGSIYHQNAQDRRASLDRCLLGHCKEIRENGRPRLDVAMRRRTLTITSVTGTERTGPDGIGGPDRVRRLRARARCFSWGTRPVTPLSPLLSTKVDNEVQRMLDDNQTEISEL
jgi:hypothetical protein